MSTIIDETWWDEQLRKEEEAYIERLKVIRAIQQANVDRHEDKKRTLELKRRRDNKRRQNEYIN